MGPSHWAAIAVIYICQRG